MLQLAELEGVIQRLLKYCLSNTFNAVLKSCFPLGEEKMSTFEIFNKNWVKSRLCNWVGWKSAGGFHLLFLAKFSHTKKITVGSLFILHSLMVPNSWSYHSFILCPGYLEAYHCIPLFHQEDVWKPPWPSSFLSAPLADKPKCKQFLSISGKSWRCWAPLRSTGSLWEAEDVGFTISAIVKVEKATQVHPALEGSRI